MACQISDSIETKDGELLTGKKEVQRRWREHFTELFQNDGEICADEPSNGIDNRILMEETRRAIGKLRSGKAGGVCDIRGEMLKARGEVTVQWLTAIFNVAWRTGKIGGEQLFAQSTRKAVGEYVRTTEGSVC